MDVTFNLDVLASLVYKSKENLDCNWNRANYHYQRFWKMSSLNKEQSESHLQEYNRHMSICDKENCRMEVLISVIKKVKSLVRLRN